MPTESEKKAIKKYLDGQEQIRFWAKKGIKEHYKELAKSAGMSLAEFIKASIDEYVQNHGL